MRWKLSAQQTFALMKTSEDVLKTSFVFVFRRLLRASSRRLDQDEYIRLSHSSSEDVLKTSSRHHNQDQYIRLGHTSSRRLQEVFKTSSTPLAKTSSRRLQKRLQDIFKTSCKDAFKIFWRRIIRLNCFPSSRICLGHTSEKFMVSVENLQVW